MIAAHDSLLDEPCWLLPYAPDWRAGVETRLSLPAEVERGLTGRESRQAYGATLRVEMRWESLLGPTEAAALRNAMQEADFDERPVWWPWWPGATEDRAAAGNVWDAAQRIRVDDPLSAQLEPLGSPAQSGNYYPEVRWAAALRGYLVERPTLTALTDELFVARFRVREDGPAALALQANGATPADGPTVAGRAHPVFPGRPGWTDPVETGRAESERDDRELGYGREAARAAYPQSPERVLRLGLALVEGQDAADLVDFFAAVGGTGGAFWCPTWLAEARLTGNVPVGAAALPVSGGDRLGGNAYLAIVGRGGPIEVLPVLEALPTSIILGAGVAQAHPLEATSLTTAALVRFARPALTLRWRAPDDVTADIELREVATAYYNPPGETHGETIGPLGQVCVLYTFTVGWVPETIYDAAPTAAAWDDAWNCHRTDVSGRVRATYDVTTTHGGFQLEIEAARATGLVEGRPYVFSGVAYSDGVTVPKLRLRLSVAPYWYRLWEGTDAAGPQPFSVLAAIPANVRRVDFYTQDPAHVLGAYIEVEDFAITEPGTADEVWRYTSYEAPVTHGGEIYTPATIEHGDLRETLGLERDEVTLRTRAAPGHPLLRFLPGPPERPLALVITEARLAPGGSTALPRQIFSGEVSRVEMDGPYLTARAAQAGNLFERKLPRVLLQPTCNYALYDGGCGLAKTAWEYRGAVLAVLAGPPRLQLSTLSRVVGPWVQPTLHWFAGGWVELGSGATWESRPITDATAYDTTGFGLIELTLGEAPGRTPAVGEVVSLYPGCDGQRATCVAKFANYARFGGFPFLPVGNPSVPKMPANRNIK